MVTRKLSVATRSSVAHTKHNKILQCLSMFPEGTTPKTIARETGINVNTVKSILPNLRGVKKIMRGFYKVVEAGDGTIPTTPDLTTWNFHNLVLTHKNIHNKSSPPSTFQFNLVKCVLSFSDNKITFRVSSDHPLNVSSICFVAGFFSHICDIPFSDVMVSTIEFNKDYRNLRLDGVKSISVDGLVEQFKVYQKKHALRIEHKTKVPMAVENIVDMLSQNPMSVDYNLKLQQQKDLLERLTRATNANTKILFDIIDKVGSR